MDQGSSTGFRGNWSKVKVIHQGDKSLGWLSWGIRVKALARVGAGNGRTGHLGVKGEHWVGRTPRECWGSEAALPGSLTVST